MRGTLFLLLTLFITLAAFSFEGARNPWVAASKWVNTQTPKTFVESAKQIDGVTSDQDVAISTFYWLLRCYGHGGGGQEGPKGNEMDVYDTWNHLHAYSMTYCDMYNRMIAEFWMAYKNEFTDATARKVNTNNNGHAEAALGWTDDQGFRFHMFDGHLGWFTYNRAGTHVASVEEMLADFTLVSNPSVPVAPYFIRRATSNFSSVCGLGDWTYVTGATSCSGSNHYAFVDYNPDIPITKYSTNFSLRNGESLKRQWFNDGKPVYAQGSSATTVHRDMTDYYYTDTHEAKDPRNQTIQSVYFDNTSTYVTTGQRVYGNAYHVYTPPLQNGKFAQSAKSTSGLTSGARVSGTPVLQAGALATEGQVTYEIYNIYNYAESFIQGSYYLKSAGSIAMEFSVDSGATWTNVLNTTTVSASVQNFNIDIGKARWDAGQTTTFNLSSHPMGAWGTPTWWGNACYHYKYQVRFKIRANNNLADVGIDSLTFKNTMMLNMFMLPALLPGANTITVTGDELSPACTLKVTYSWDENGTPRTNVENITALPHTYSITVNETDTLSVKCKYIEMATFGTGTTTGVKNPVKREFNGFFSVVSPNPFGPKTSILFSFPASVKVAGPVSAVIYDVNGQKINAFTLAPDARQLVWDGRNARGETVGPGVYFVRISTLSGQSLKIKVAKM